MVNGNHYITLKQPFKEAVFSWQHRYLSEEALTAPASWGGIVDVDVVILSRDGLFHERLLEHFSINLHMVLPLQQVTFYQTNKMGS